MVRILYENRSSLKVYQHMIHRFTDATGYLTYPDPRIVTPPPKGWVYDEPWHIDMAWEYFRGSAEGEEGREAPIDEDGWQYADNPFAKKWSSQKAFLHTCQRRRWICKLRKVKEGEGEREK